MSKDAAGLSQSKARVFISYSRKDHAFVDRLHQALKAAGHEVFVDTQVILPGEPWQERLGALITSADAVVFCLSPDFVSSPVCEWEINEAERLGKRLLPAVIADTPPDAVPQRLKRLNYIYCTDATRFADSVRLVTAALQTDIAWVREHTRLSERVAEWQASDKPEFKLLSGADVSKAEAWLASRPRDAPDITNDIGAFILNSRAAMDQRLEAARRRSHAITGATLCVTAFVMWLGWLMHGQWRDSQQRESLALADIAFNELRENRPMDAALLAMEALPDPADRSLVRRTRPYVTSADLALDLASQEGRYFERALRGHQGGIASAVFSPDGRYVATCSMDETVRLWNVATGQFVAELGRDRLTAHLAFSPDGTLLAGASATGTIVWTVATHETRLIAPPLDGMGEADDAGDSAVLFSPDGRFLASVSGHGSVRVWRTDTFDAPIVLKEPFAKKNTVDAILQSGSVAFAPDSRTLAVVIKEHGVRLWNVIEQRSTSLLGSLDEGITGASVSPDGRSVATISRSGVGKIWDIDAGMVRTELQGHTEPLTYAIFSADSKYVATASQDETARLWDADTGKELRVLRGHTAAVWGLAAGRDSVLATAASDSTIRVWIDTEKVVVITWDGPRLIDGTHGKFQLPIQIAFAPDGKRLLSYSFNDAVVRIWEPTLSRGTHLSSKAGTEVTNVAFLADGQRLAQAARERTARITALDGAETTVLHSRQTDLTDIAFSADGRWLATSARDHTVRLWDVAVGREVAIFNGHYEAVNALAFSPDGGRLVAGAVDGRLILWDIQTRTAVKTWTLPKRITAMAYATDGRRLAVTGADVHVLDVDAADGTMAILKGHTDDVSAVSFSSDGQWLATGSQDGTIRIWDAVGLREVAALPARDTAVTGVAFAPDGKRIAASYEDHAGRVWDLASQRDVMVLKGHTDKLAAIDFAPDGRRIATAGHDGTARLWNAEDGTELVALPHETQPDEPAVRRVRFSRDGRLLATATVDGVQTWHGTSGAKVAILRSPGHKRWLRYVATSADGRRMATSGDDNEIIIWDTEPQRMTAEFTHEGAYASEGGVGCVVLSRDGSRLVSISNTATRLWNAATGEAMADLGKRSLFATGCSAAFTADGLRIASVDEDGIRYWDAMTAQEVGVLTLNENKITQMAYFPDSQRLAVVEAGDAKILEARSGRVLAELKGHTNTVTCVAVSPDGQLLATVSSDGTARLWHGDTGKEVALHRLDGRGHCITFSPKGDLLAIALDNGVRLWPVPPPLGERLAQMKQTLDRCLTAEQRQKFHLATAPPRWCFDQKKWPYDDPAATAPPPLGLDERLFSMLDAVRALLWFR